MPIPEKYLAVLEPGCIYHVFNRSHELRKLFYETDNYRHFLSLIKKYLSDVIEIHAFCLLPNHFHLVIRVQSDSTHVSLAFRQMFISYTHSINKRMGIRGNLFATPFRRILIQDDTYYSKIIAYIHLNPIKHRIQKTIPYTYSSYNEIANDKSTICNSQYVLDWFGGKQQFIHYHELIAAEMLQG